jgi:hypothetical protein
MKRVLLLTVAALTLASASLAAQSYTTYASMVPKTAKSMGLGGVFSSVPTAEFSFFGNPASFAAPKATLILPTLDAVVYLKPTSGNIDKLTNGMGDQKSIINTAVDLMADNGGAGFGLNTGIGLAGRGLGVGVFLTEDTYMEGSNLASGLLHTDAQGTAVVGLGFPLQLGDLRLALGGDIRPFYRVSLQPTVLTKVVTPMLNDEDPTKVIDAYAFFGVAMDLGATLQLSSLTLGLSIRDIAPAFPLWSGTLADLKANAAAGTDTSGSDAFARFIPNVTLGLSWAPQILPGIIDPTVYFEVQDPVAVFSSSDGAGTALNLFHAGAEVKLLSFIYLRGGINRGWLSAGAGVKLLFIDLNASVFTEELGTLPGDQPRSGMAVQAAIRF